MATRFLLSLLIPLGLCPSAHAVMDAERLYDDLINGYNNGVRPVGNHSDQLTVRLSLRLSQLIEVVGVRARRLQNKLT